MKNVIFYLIIILPILSFSQQIKEKKDSTVNKKPTYTWEGRVVKKKELKSLMKSHYLNYIDSVYSPTKKSSQN